MTSVNLTPPSPNAPRVLSIAGTDPTGGAGIQADLKSIAANGGYGMAVVTALVAQNTMGVRAIHAPPVEFLAQQLDAVSDDVTIDAVKIGMLFNTEIIATVARWLQQNRPPFVVFDPVMIAASGDRLLNSEAESAVRNLLAEADLVTPNIPELAALVQERQATSWGEAVAQARTLAATHDVLVLMKGGHLDGPDSNDALVDANGIVDTFESVRVDTGNTHGTGCSLSSAIATVRAQSAEWPDAIRAAKSWLTESIIAADDLNVGKGSGPVSHFAGLWRRGGTFSTTAHDVARRWWQGIEQIRTDIDRLDFVAGMANGTLDHDAFIWYLKQDALYLRDYSRALAAASALAPTPAEQAFWASNAHGALVSELELHGTWLPEATMFDALPSNTTIGYVDHFLAIAARGNYEELIAALLPCFWIYVDVGSRLAPLATPENPYNAWLQTYGDPEFAALNHQAIDIVTSRAAAASPHLQTTMWQAFEKSARHELNFFAAPLQRG